MGLIEQFMTLQNFVVALEEIERKLAANTCVEAEYDLFSEHDKMLDAMANHIKLMNRTSALRSALQAFSASDIGGKLVAEHDA